MVTTVIVVVSGVNNLLTSRNMISSAKMKEDVRHKETIHENKHSGIKPKHLEMKGI